MKKVILLIAFASSLMGQIFDPFQRQGPGGSVEPRLYFGTTPNSATGNLSGDFFVTPTQLYTCTAPSGTAAPACTGVGPANWQSVTLVANLPVFSITMSHSGSFQQGQVGATYTIAVSNVGTAATNGLVTVNLIPPTFGTGNNAGMTITAASGTGWTCTVLAKTCTRSDALAVSGSYPNIMETVTVASNAPTPLVNAANISGGGATGTVGTTDVTTITLAATPDMTITLSHSGNFAQGQTGATYSIIASNVGGASSSGLVTVTDTVPSGLTATAMTGSGWTCNSGTGVCTRSDALAASAAYPTITLTVNVSGTSPNPVTNTVTVAGGGETNTTNDVASDPTVVTGSGIPVSDAFPGSTLNAGIWTVLNPAGGTVTVSSAQAHLAVPGGANHDPEDTGVDQSLRIAQTISNVDFQATVEFDSIPNTQYQFEGFLVKQDTNMNFMRFQIGFDGTLLRCNADILLAGVDTSPINVNIPGSPTSLWLRITRQGSNWTEFYSSDGVTYNTCGSASQVFTIDEFDIWAGNFNATPASSPAFTALAKNFVGQTISTGAGCTTTITTSGNVQTSLSALTSGQTLCLTSGTYNIGTPLTMVAGTTLTSVTTQGAILNATGAPPLIKIPAGSSTMVTNLILNGGGIEITGGVSGMTISGNLIRNINTNNTGLNPQSAGIFQDAITSTFITSSTINHNQFTNIYAPGELTCNGSFPPTGQPCDYTHDGIDLYLINALTIDHNVFNTVSGDAVHLFQDLSCQDIFGTGPGGNQPNNQFTYNTIAFNHRLPLEFQPCHFTNGLIDHNVIYGTYLPSAWNIGISFAAGTGAATTTTTISNNYVDGASNTGPGWNIFGPCYEVGGNATAISGNFCTTALGSNGFSFYQEFTSVFGNAEAYSNNQYCGPNIQFATYDPTQCGTNGVSCTPYTTTNNLYTASCVGFPARPVIQ